MAKDDRNGHSSPESRNTQTLCVVCFWNRRHKYVSGLSMGREKIRYYSWRLMMTVLNQGCGYRTFFGTVFILILTCASQFIQFSFSTDFLLLYQHILNTNWVPEKMTLQYILF